MVVPDLRSIQEDGKCDTSASWATKFGAEMLDRRRGLRCLDDLYFTYP